MKKPRLKSDEMQETSVTLVGGDVEEDHVPCDDENEQAREDCSNQSRCTGSENTGEISSTEENDEDLFESPAGVVQQEELCFKDGDGNSHSPFPPEEMSEDEDGGVDEGIMNEVRKLNGQTVSSLRETGDVVIVPDVLDDKQRGPPHQHADDAHETLRNSPCGNNQHDSSTDPMIVLESGQVSEPGVTLRNKDTSTQSITSGFKGESRTAKGVKELRVPSTEETPKQLKHVYTPGMSIKESKKACLSESSSHHQESVKEILTIDSDDEDVQYCVSEEEEEMEEEEERTLCHQHASTQTSLSSLKNQGVQTERPASKNTSKLLTKVDIGSIPCNLAIGLLQFCQENLPGYGQLVVNSVAFYGQEKPPQLVRIKSEPFDDYEEQEAIQTSLDEDGENDERDLPDSDSYLPQQVVFKQEKMDEDEFGFGKSSSYMGEEYTQFNLNSQPALSGDSAGNKGFRDDNNMQNDWSVDERNMVSHWSVMDGSASGSCSLEESYDQQVANQNADEVRDYFRHNMFEGNRKDVATPKSNSKQTSFLQDPQTLTRLLLNTKSALSKSPEKKFLSKDKVGYMFSCRICKKKFNDRSNWKRHERLHSGEKPYLCAFCDKRWARLDGLRSHIRIKHPEQHKMQNMGENVHFATKIHRRNEACKSLPFCDQVPRTADMHPHSAPVFPPRAGDELPTLPALQSSGSEQSFSETVTESGHLLDYGVLKGLLVGSKNNQENTTQQELKTLNLMVCGDSVLPSTGYPPQLQSQLHRPSQELTNQIVQESHKLLPAPIRNFTQTSIQGSSYQNADYGSVSDNVQDYDSLDSKFDPSFSIPSLSIPSIEDPSLPSAVDSRSYQMANQVGKSVQNSGKNDNQGFVPKYVTQTLKKKLVLKNKWSNPVSNPVDNGLMSCRECGRQFTDKSNLRRHIRIHTGEKRFKCPKCDRKFTRHDNLKSHLVVHAGRILPSSEVTDTVGS